jgi:uncharacterized membrane protein YeaQ/YmgE (transglycosylase-associated protein family)
MTFVELLILLAVAGICGAIGQAVTGFSRGGCLVSMALGFIGALVGTWIAAQLGLPEIFALQVGEQSFPIIWSIMGAIVIVLIVGIMTGRKRL